MVEIKIKYLTETAKEPGQMTAGSAGYDIYADNDDNITIVPLGRALIPTGMSVSIPIGYEAQIRSRSGLAFKHGIIVLNSPGTIDSDYRGEIKVILLNLSENDFVINRGMRIAQMIISKCEKIKFKKVSILEETNRNDGGFGHTD